MTTQVVLSVIRYALFCLASILATRGLMTEEQAQQVAGYLMGAITVVWGVIENLPASKIKQVSNLSQVSGVKLTNGFTVTGK